MTPAGAMRAVRGMGRNLPVAGQLSQSNRTCPVFRALPILCRRLAILGRRLRGGRPCRLGGGNARDKGQTPHAGHPNDAIHQFAHFGFHRSEDTF